MPDDYYVSQYSGEEIDERLTAAYNAVRYDAAQTLTDAQKAQARGNINAAPGGFGLGDRLPKNVESWDDATANGFYNGPAPSGFGLGSLWGFTSNLADGYITQTMYTDRGNGCVAIRFRLNNVWQPLEWVNPPLELGVEYRTTERYLGKPVYVKAVECGTIPINSVKAVSFDPSYDDVSTSSTFRALCVWGVTSGHWTLPALLYGYGLDRSINIGGYFNGILIGTTETGTPDTITAVVKYIKTTD